MRLYLKHYIYLVTLKLFNSNGVFPNNEQGPVLLQFYSNNDNLTCLFLTVKCYFGFQYSFNFIYIRDDSSENIWLL